MRIAINAQLLSYSQNYRNGGISRYIRHLLTGLAKHPGEHEYTVFVNGQEVADRLAAEQPLPANMRLVPIAWSEAKPLARVAWEQFNLPTLLRQHHIEVFHSPANVLPELLPRNCASVVTLHDLAFLRFPEVLTRPKRVYHRTFTLRSLRRATRVIAVSNSTKQDAMKLVHIPANRIQTVYLCIDTCFSSVIIDEDISAFRQRRGLTGGYILYLGTLEPRKNIPTLLKAYAQLRAQYGREEPLVLAGGKGWLYDTIFEQVQQLGLQASVIFPGFIPDEEQPAWYRGASLFVYPSLYEGFGIPVAEALACGTPVVTSNTSSLPEAGAGLALTVNPLDHTAMAETMYKALTDQELRLRCKQSAPTVASTFSAPSMVEQTLSVYEQAIHAHTRFKNVSLYRSRVNRL